MNFGDNLKRLRKFKKISQEKLAERVGVSRQAVSKWETGESYPEMNNILEICKIFHCNINELVNDNIVDVNSLDKEIMMNVVKFNEKKQKNMKGVCKVLSILFAIGKWAFRFLTVVTVAVMLMAIPTIYERNKSNYECKLETNAKDVKIEEKGDKVSIIFDAKKMSDLKIKEVNNIEYDKEVYTEEEIEKMKEDEYSVYSEDNDNVVMSKILKSLENKSDTEAIVLVESGLLCVTAYFLLMSIINKKLNKLFKNFANGETPFTLINMQYIKFTAKLFIVSAIIQFVGSILLLSFGYNPASIGFQVSLVEVLLVVAFTYLFQYGYEIQLDSNSKMFGNE